MEHTITTKKVITALGVVTLAYFCLKSVLHVDSSTASMHQDSKFVSSMAFSDSESAMDKDFFKVYESKSMDWENSYAERRKKHAKFVVVHGSAQTYHLLKMERDDMESTTIGMVESVSISEAKQAEEGNIMIQTPPAVTLHFYHSPDMEMVDEGDNLSDVDRRMTKKNTKAYSTQRMSEVFPEVFESLKDVWFRFRGKAEEVLSSGRSCAPKKGSIDCPCKVCVGSASSNK